MPQAARKSSATAPTVVSPHGPGGLLNTPGLGTASRRWGRRKAPPPKQVRQKANYSATAGQTITGALARGADGRFTRAGAGGDRRPTAPGRRPAARPARRAGPTPEERRAARQTAAQANRATVASALAAQDAPLSARGLDALTTLRGGGDVPGSSADGLIRMGLAERGQDGRVRLSGAGRAALGAADRGDVTGVLDAVSRGGDRAAAARSREEARAQRAADRQARQAEQQQRREEQAARRSGGGGRAARASGAAARAQQARERAEVAAATGAALGISAAAVDTLRAAAVGQAGGRDLAALRQLGLVGDDGVTTDQGRRALAALERGDVRQATAALQDARSRMERAADVARRRQQREAIREREARWRAEAIARAAKAFAVYKDARSGRLRWISRTTTAFRDRDGEILSVAALERAAARMRATGQYGPLRWWHVGDPTPLDSARPWGPGLDLGMCDTSIVVGRTLVESGTFYDDAVGVAMAEKAADFEMSPGFYYAPEWREPDGTFTDIAVFERSPVPTRYGRASNYFTGLMVKEHRMNEQEIARRLAALKAETGADDATIARLASDLRASEKAADSVGVAFKAAPTVYTGPDGTPGIIQDGRWVALKAAMPPAEMVQAGETEAQDGAAEELAEDMDEPVGDFIGDMSRADFEGMLMDVFARAIQQFGGDITTQLNAFDEQLKGMGYARSKEAGELATVTAKVAQLETQLKAARQQLAALSDDAARRGRPYRPSEDAPEADEATAQRLKEEARPAVPTTGDPAVDQVARWLAADGQLPPIPGLNGLTLPGLIPGGGGQ